MGLRAGSIVPHMSTWLPPLLSFPTFPLPCRRFLHFIIPIHQPSSTPPLLIPSPTLALPLHLPSTSVIMSALSCPSHHPTHLFSSASPIQHLLSYSTHLLLPLPQLPWLTIPPSCNVCISLSLKKCTYVFTIDFTYTFFFTMYFTHIYLFHHQQLPT